MKEAEAGRAEILIPAIVPIELVLLREAGRRVVGPAEIEALLNAQAGISVAGFDLEQAARTSDRAHRALRSADRRGFEIAWVAADHPR